MSAMDEAWFLLKQTYQSELGEHHDDFPSSYGPVVGYHGTTGDNFMDIMGGAGLQTHDPNYPTISTNPSESATYANIRASRNTDSRFQSQPKLIGVRQAAFDQNHPNYIGPSQGFTHRKDYEGAQHFGGNIPRQFLTNVPMSNDILQDTMYGRDGRQSDLDINMSLPAESQRHASGRVQETTPIQFPLMNQRGEVRPQEPSSRMRWSRTYDQSMDDYNQQMAQYMEPTPVQQPQDAFQTQLNFE